MSTIRTKRCSSNSANMPHLAHKLFISLSLIFYKKCLEKIQNNHSFYGLRTVHRSAEHCTFMHRNKLYQLFKILERDLPAFVFQKGFFAWRFSKVFCGTCAILIYLKFQCFWPLKIWVIIVFIIATNFSSNYLVAFRAFRTLICGITIYVRFTPGSPFMRTTTGENF